MPVNFLCFTVNDRRPLIFQEKNIITEYLLQKTARKITQSACFLFIWNIIHRSSADDTELCFEKTRKKIFRVFGPQFPIGSWKAEIEPVWNYFTTEVTEGSEMKKIINNRESVKSFNNFGW